MAGARDSAWDRAHFTHSWGRQVNGREDKHAHCFHRPWWPHCPRHEVPAASDGTVTTGHTHHRLDRCTSLLALPQPNTEGWAA